MKYDLIGYGAAAVDDLVFVEPFPLPNTKQPVLRRERHGGGLTATALVAAARLGLKCFYGGFLGDNELSNFLRGLMEREKIELPKEIPHPEAGPCHSIILVEQSSGQRSILWNIALIKEPVLDLAKIAQSKCLFVDQVHASAQVPGAREARRLGIPVVGDFEAWSKPSEIELASLTGHLILPLEWALKMTNSATPHAAVEKLMTADYKRDLVCVTDGENGAWFAHSDGGGRVFHQPAFPIKPVDTTGCGDVFHGVYAAALTMGKDPAERVRLASAAAAFKATRPGAQTGAPHSEELAQFLKARE